MHHISSWRHDGMAKRQNVVLASNSLNIGNRREEAEAVDMNVRKSIKDQEEEGICLTPLCRLRQGKASWNQEGRRKMGLGAGIPLPEDDLACQGVWKAAKGRMRGPASSTLSLPVW